MPIEPGGRLGPYEVLALLGTGGMGRVFRAHDTRLDRDVAIKVLLKGAGGDEDRLRRFEQEARVIGALNHPNVVVIHDTGRDEGSPYLVTELLEGDTLRERLRRGPLTERKAVEIAIQIARGLAAAHDKGITHRDLKPENVFLTRDGQVKILDFGLAHIGRTEPGGPETGSGSGSGNGTLSLSGAVMGTAGYMAPEQIRGRPVDPRADIFALGAVLYELLCGRRAFPGETAVDRGLEALHSEPRGLAAISGLSPSLVALVSRCLEKRPEDRFQSAHDVAFALETYPTQPWDPGPGTRRRRQWNKELWVAGVATLLLLALAGGMRLWRSTREELLPRPSFTRVTYRPMVLGPARFAPDEQTVLLTANLEGGPRVYATLPEWMELRPLTATGHSLSAVSQDSELAVLTSGIQGRLGRVGMTSSAVREVAEHADSADFAPSGELMIVQSVAPLRSFIEYPIGKVIFETDAGLDSCRFSPDGKRIACIHRHPGVFDLDVPGVVLVIDLQGRSQEVGGWWNNIQGLAWAPGEEIWISATRQGQQRGLFGVDLRGQVRPLLIAPTDLLLHDVSHGGRALIRRGDGGRSVRLLSGDGEERDLSWLAYSAAVDLTADGKQLLLVEDRGTFLRPVDGAAAVLVAQGVEGRAISSDGRTVLACADPPRCSMRRLIPTGVGLPVDLPRGAVDQFWDARFFDSDRQLVFTGRADGESLPRVWTQGLEGEPRPISPPGIHSPLPSPDGQWFAAQQDSGVVLLPLQGGVPAPLPGDLQGKPVGWTREGQLLVARLEEKRLVVQKVNVRTGQGRVWRTLKPPDRSGFLRFEGVVTHPDGQVAYTFLWGTGDLFIVDGLTAGRR